MHLVVANHIDLLLLKKFQVILHNFKNFLRLAVSAEENRLHASSYSLRLLQLSQSNVDLKVSK